MSDVTGRADNSRRKGCSRTYLSGGNGAPRGGTINQGGRLLEIAERTNNTTYHEVLNSGLGSLQCLGYEVFGRWSSQCIALVPALARERCRGLHPRICRGAAVGLQHRWWGILGVALQRAVANVVLNPESADLSRMQLEPMPSLADLRAALLRKSRC